MVLSEVVPALLYVVRSSVSQVGLTAAGDPFGTSPLVLGQRVVGSPPPHFDVATESSTADAIVWHSVGLGQLFLRTDGLKHPRCFAFHLAANDGTPRTKSCCVADFAVLPLVVR